MTNSLWALAGYLGPLAWLYSGILTRPLRGRLTAFAAAVFFAAWAFVSIPEAWRLVPGPAVLWILSAMFLTAWRKTLRSEAEHFESSAKKLSAARMPVEKELAAVSRECDRLSRALEKTAGIFAAVKESLSRMEKTDICRRAVEILSGIEGVSGAAVYDDTLKLLAGSPLDGYRNAAASCGGPSPAAGFVTMPAVWGSRRFGTLVAAVTPSADAVAVSDILAPFAVGYVRAALFEEYQLKSRRDALTGIFNRRYFETKLDMEVRRSARYGNTFAVIMLDIDHFKKVNDTYGHPAGDAALLKLASILDDFDYPGSFAGRYGGEEFVLCLPLCAREAVAGHAERLRGRVASMDFYDEKNNMLQCALSVSVGGAIYPDNGSSPESVLEAADAALYEAKTAGRNRVCVKPAKRENKDEL